MLPVCAQVCYKRRVPEQQPPSAMGSASSNWKYSCVSQYIASKSIACWIQCSYCGEFLHYYQTVFYSLLLVVFV